MTLPLNNQPAGGSPPYYDDIFKKAKTEAGLYYRPSLSYSSQIAFNPGGTNRLWVMPFVPEKDIDITEIGMWLDSGTPLSTVVGIYNNENPNPGEFGRPTTLRVQGATVVTPSVGANISAVSSTSLLKDVLYWLAFKSATGTTSVTSILIDLNAGFSPMYTRGPVDVGSFLGGSHINSIQQCFYTDATAQGATIVLDADLTATSLTQTIQAPMVFVGPTP